MDSDLEGLLESQDVFKYLKTASVTPVIGLLPKPQLTTLRNRTLTPNSASVTSDGSQITVSTGTTTGTVATCDTHQWGRYITGFMGVYGIRIQIPTQPTGDAEIRFGPFNDQNGVIHGQDKDGFFVRVRDGGSDENKLRESDFADPLPDWFDLQNGLIIRDLFTHYGEGSWNIAGVKGDGGSTKRKVVDSLVPSGSDPLIEQPNLPIRVEVDNGTTTTDFTANIIGRQFDVIGEYQPARRKISESRESATISTSGYTPLVSYRFKRPGLTGVSTDYRPVEVKLSEVDILSETDPVRFQVRRGTSLTGASWGNPTDVSAEESPVQSDVSATALSGGEKLDGGILEGGKSSKVAVEEQDLNISPPMENTRS